LLKRSADVGDPDAPLVDVSHFLRENMQFLLSPSGARDSNLDEARRCLKMPGYQVNGGAAVM
jgi:hypothetical protein